MFDDVTGKIPGRFSDLFKKKKKRCVGVDVGNSSIKIVELEKKGDKIVLKNYSITRTNKKGLVKPGSSKIIDTEVGDIVKKILDEIEVKTKNINVAIPSFASLVTTIELPPASEKEIEQIIQVEAPKYIPVPLEEIVYGWEIINDKAESDEQKNESKITKASDKSMIKVVLVSVMKSISQEYEKVFQKSGYNIDSLEIDAFALKRAMVGDDQKSYLMVDIGGTITNISVIVNGSVVANRSIDVGGERMTELLSKALGVNEERAEKIKVSQGFEIESREIKTQVLEPFFKNISDEIVKSIEVFDENYPNLEIDSLVLTGGLSQMKGVINFLENKIKIKIVEGNPWLKIVYPKKIENSLFSLNPYFGVAIGLALKGLMEE